MEIIKNIAVPGKHKKPIVTDLFFKDNKQPKKIIIFCHGYKGFKDWGAWNLMAEAFAKAGFFFIKFNFSHNGGTLEQPIDFPDLDAFGNNNYSKELDDLEGILNWISTNTAYKEEINIDAISIIGHSRGGGIVLLKTHQDSRIKNVITLAGVSDYKSRFPKNDAFTAWKEKGVYHVKNGRTHQEMPHFYQFYEDFIKNEERLTIKDAVQHLKVPHLIIHGDQDTSVLINEAENLKNWNAKSSFVIIKEANHVFNVAHPWIKNDMSEALQKVVNSCIDFIK